MRVHRSGLNRGEMLACTLRDVKAAFDPQVLEWVSFAKLGRIYESKDAHLKRKLTGKVIAHCSGRQGKPGSLCLYPVAQSSYSEWASADFVHQVLPKMAEWLGAKVDGTDTAPDKRDDFVVEWTDDGHRIHVVNGGVGRHR